MKTEHRHSGLVRAAGSAIAPGGKSERFVGMKGYAKRRIFLRGKGVIAKHGARVFGRGEAQEVRKQDREQQEQRQEEGEEEEGEG